MLAPCALLRKLRPRCRTLIITWCRWESVRPQHGFWLHKDLAARSKKSIKESAAREFCFFWGLILCVWITAHIAYANFMGCSCWMNVCFKKSKIALAYLIFMHCLKSQILIQGQQDISSNKNNSVRSLIILSLPSLSHEWDKVSSFQDAALIQRACKPFDSVCVLNAT